MHKVSMLFILLIHLSPYSIACFSYSAEQIIPEIKASVKQKRSESTIPEDAEWLIWKYLMYFFFEESSEPSGVLNARRANIVKNSFSNLCTCVSQKVCLTRLCVRMVFTAVYSQRSRIFRNQSQIVLRRLRFRPRPF